MSTLGLDPTAILGFFLLPFLLPYTGLSPYYLSMGTAVYFLSKAAGESNPSWHFALGIVTRMLAVYLTFLAMVWDQAIQHATSLNLSFKGISENGIVFEILI